MTPAQTNAQVLLAALCTLSVVLTGYVVFVLREVWFRFRTAQREHKAIEQEKEEGQ